MGTTECTVETANECKSEGTLDTCDESDCDGTCTATESKCDVHFWAASNNSHK